MKSKDETKRITKIFSIYQ